jgi:two-component system sensor histidine kinase/response regulator
MIEPCSAAPAAADVVGRVLVVDDEVKNRELLRALLEAQGHQVSEARDGQEGLAAAIEGLPDVVLLDVMMPNLDGLEVCRRLKAAAKTAPIPVLLVTSLSDRKERLEGIKAGASDFITKPVDTADLVLRVRNAVAGKRLFDRLEAQYQRLRELEGMRDNLVHMIIHDLRSPLAGVYTYLQLLDLELNGVLDPKRREYLGQSIAILNRVQDMTNAVLDVSRFESNQMPMSPASVDLYEVVTEAIQSLGSAAAPPRVLIERSEAPVIALCDREIIRRVVANLVGNALKFTPEVGQVRVTMRSGERDVEVAVADTGRGIPPEHQQRIFEKFGQVGGPADRARHSAGLGLTFCKMAVEAHGGIIGVNSVVGKGSTFWFRLPHGPPANGGRQTHH